jgi:hypothetical protein
MELRSRVDDHRLRQFFKLEQIWTNKHGKEMMDNLVDDKLMET